MHIKKLIVQPDHGVAPVIEFLRSARSSLLVKQFTFDHPALIAELVDRRKAGIAMKVMLNPAKATGERLNDGTFEALKDAGIDVAWSCPDFVVTHEKSVVADGEKVLLSTFNFMAKYYAHTRDYGVVFADPLSVEEIKRCFECDWQRVHFQPLHSHDLAWSPGSARAIICNLLDNAKQSIDIQHPKFAEPVVFERVHAALMRGVAVRLLCGGKHGIRQPDLMYSYALWRIFRKAGGKLRKQNHLKSHGKLVIVDGSKALLGSQNLDQPAFDTRREVGVVVEGEEQLKDLGSVFEADWDASHRYKPPYPTSQLDDPDGEFPHEEIVFHD